MKGRGTTDAIFALKRTIDSELTKERGKVWAFMADLKGAFDRVKREVIWKEMEKIEIEEKLRTRIRELYERTSCKVVIDGKAIGKFETRDGIRQGCPLSPTLFNITMSELETEMRKVQGGIVIGRNEIYSIWIRR